MEQSAFDALTDRQRDCLRLVYAHYDSKEIARKLKLSHHTINKYLEAATRSLGASDRKEAARLLWQHEAKTPYDRFVCEPLELSEYSNRDMLPSIERPHSPNDGGSGVSEDRSIFSPEAKPFSPLKETRRNALTKPQRMVVILTLVFVISTAAFLGVAGVYVIELLLKH